MANGDYVVRLRGEDSLSPTLEKVKRGIAEVSDKSGRLNDISEQFKKIDSSSAPLKKKLRDIQKLLGEMQYNGDNTSELFLQMSQAAGEYADALNDARAAVNAFADDQLSLKAGIGVFQGLTAAASVTTGVIGLFGEQNEKVTQAILKVQSALSILNGLQTISNLLNKDSVLVLKLRQIQMNLMTAAQVKNAVATAACSTKTKIDTAVQTAWNVAKAVAKALLGDFTGLALVAAGAVATYAVATAGSTEEQKKQNKELELSKEKMEDLASSYASTASDLISKYKSLKKAFEDAGGASNLTQEEFKKHKTELHKLGIEVNTTSDLENVYVKNTNATVRALQLRAKAMALAAMETKALAAELEALMNLELSEHKKGDSGQVDAVKKAAEYYGVKNDGLYYRRGAYGHRLLTDKGAALLNRYDREVVKPKEQANLKRQYQKVQDWIETQRREIEKEASNLPVTISLDPEITTDTDNDNPKNKAVDRLEEELKKIQDKIKQEQSKYNSASYDADEMERLRKRERQLQNELELRKAISELAYDDGRVDSTLKTLSNLKNLQLKVDVNDTETFDLIQKLIDENIINLVTKIDESSYLKAQDKLKLLTDIKKNFDIDDIEVNAKINTAEANILSDLVIKDIAKEINNIILERFWERLKEEVQDDPLMANVVLEETIDNKLRSFFEKAQNGEPIFRLFDVEDTGSIDSIERVLSLVEKWRNEVDATGQKMNGLGDSTHKVLSLMEELARDLYNERAMRLNDEFGLEIPVKLATIPQSNLAQYKKQCEDQLGTLEVKLNLGEMGISEAYDEIHRLSTDLLVLFGYDKFNFTITVDDKGSFKILDSATAKMQAFRKEQEQVNRQWDLWSTKMNAVSGSLGSFGSAFNSISQMFPSEEDGINAVEVIGNTISAIGDLMGQYVTAAMQIQQYNLMKQQEALVTQNAAQAKLAEAAASSMATSAQIANTTATAADTTVTTTNTGAKTALSMANIIASLTQAPWFMVLPLVAAGVATIAGLISSFVKPQAFADGGIVGGNSFTGDKVLSRLNSGEMVINRKDQASLWNFIKDGSPSSRAMGGNVTFTLQGSTLQGVLNNYNRKNRQVR